MLRIAATCLVLSGTTLFVAGCGGSGQSPAEARFVALAEAICLKTNTIKAESPPTSAEFAKLRSLAESARKAPRVATFLSDLAVRQRLRAALSKLANRKSNAPEAGSYLEKSYRLNVKVYADEKALGLTSCLGSPPRKPIEG